MLSKILVCCLLVSSPMYGYGMGLGLGGLGMGYGMGGWGGFGGYPFGLGYGYGMPHFGGLGGLGFGGLGGGSYMRKEIGMGGWGGAGGLGGKGMMFDDPRLDDLYAKKSAATYGPGTLGTYYGA